MSSNAKNPKGAGVKKDSIRPKLTSYWTQEDVKDYFVWLKKSYKKSPQLAKFVGEQLMGKAIQPLTGEDGGPIRIEGVNIVIKK